MAHKLGLVCFAFLSIILSLNASQADYKAAALHIRVVDCEYHADALEILAYIEQHGPESRTQIFEIKQKEDRCQYNDIPAENFKQEIRRSEVVDQLEVENERYILLVVRKPEGLIYFRIIRYPMGAGRHVKKHDEPMLRSRQFSVGSDCV